MMDPRDAAKRRIRKTVEDHGEAIEREVIAPLVKQIGALVGAIWEHRRAIEKHDREHGRCISSTRADRELWRTVERLVDPITSEQGV